MIKLICLFALFFAFTNFAQDNMGVGTTPVTIKAKVKVADTLKKTEPIKMTVGKPVEPETTNTAIAVMTVKKIYETYPFSSWFFTVILVFWLIRILLKVIKK